MKHLANIIRVLIVAALMPVSAASGWQPERGQENTYEVCIGDWSDLWSQSEDSEKVAQSSERAEVFCGHFTGTQDIPFDHASVDATTVVPYMFATISPDIHRVGAPEKLSVPDDVIPTSLNPEVLPHPPMFY